MVWAADIDGDGKVDYEEFVTYMKKDDTDRQSEHYVPDQVWVPKQ